MSSRKPTRPSRVGGPSLLSGLLSTGPPEAPPVVGIDEYSTFTNSENQIVSESPKHEKSTVDKDVSLPAVVGQILDHKSENDDTSVNQNSSQFDDDDEDYQNIVEETSKVVESELVDDEDNKKDSPVRAFRVRLPSGDIVSVVVPPGHSTAYLLSDNDQNQHQLDSNDNLDIEYIKEKVENSDYSPDNHLILDDNRIKTETQDQKSNSVIHDNDEGSGTVTENADSRGIDSEVSNYQDQVDISHNEDGTEDLYVQNRISNVLKGVGSESLQRVADYVSDNELHMSAGGKLTEDAVSAILSVLYDDTSSSHPEGGGDSLGVVSVRSSSPVFEDEGSISPVFA